MATIKQKRVIDKLVENGGNISKAMEASGYSKNTAHSPDKLTKSKGWQELIKQYLPDDKLLAKHNEALEAIKINEFSGERLPDHNIRLKAVELGYKIKGKLNDSTGNIIGDKQVIIVNYGNKSKTLNPSPSDAPSKADTTP